MSKDIHYASDDKELREEEFRHLAASIDLHNAVINVTNLLTVRKMYALIYIDSRDDDPRWTESKDGIDFCNNTIKQVLGII